LLGEVQVHLLKGHALEAYRSRSIGFVFQEHLLLPHLTALENVLLPCLGKRDTAPVNRASDLLGRMGLADHVFDLPKTLSGGERQRVALARALIHDPQLILADEPTGSLDQSRAEEQVELLLSEARENGRIVVMVTHNLLLAHRFDRTLSLEQGRLVQEGA
jgi:lipoprotein-releasing system ATP-binding protein